MTLTFDLLTLKPICESHQSWGTFLPKFGHAGPLDSRIIRYVRDGRADRRQTEGRRDRQKQLLLPPSLRAWHKKKLFCGVNFWKFRINYAYSARKTEVQQEFVCFNQRCLNVDRCGL